MNRITSDLKTKSIVCKHHIIRKFRIYVDGFSNMMATMREPSLFHPKVLGDLNRLFQIDMGIVLFPSQSLDNQVLDTPQTVDGGVGDLIEIGDIGETSETERIRRKGIVFQPDRLHMKVPEVEGCLINEMHFVGGSAGIKMLLEGV